MSGSTLLELYKAPVVLWVEDELTRAVLSELWWDKDIAIYIGGKKEIVMNFVHFVPRRELGPVPPKFLHDKVYGLVDCDFDEPDEPHWRNPDKRLFKTPCHEFENYLLDFNLMAALSKETAQEIEQRAKARVGELLWWIACKATIRRIRASVSVAFPSDPGEPQPGTQLFQTKKEATEHIIQDNFLARQSSAFSHWNAAEISRTLQEYYERWQEDLTSGEWVKTFSGKEIFRHVRTVVKGLNPRSTEPDLDLAKSIARRMKQAKQEPASLVELRRVIRQKAGLRV